MRRCRALLIDSDSAMADPRHKRQIRRPLARISNVRLLSKPTVLILTEARSRAVIVSQG
ncbi:uncharacterized protein BJ212DRAFT_759466 [Suillus subaureus]|uniref:Uncharacterized protein n=1 Tax=Suillus subaureus TaxID=48587 RepID=A0A9P7DHF9_9AGAM|nr:uncharacterized protein BJ212DRAFT_787320 [Suillus subaureus]XP_041187995.1 uncharacterized protein BJ212DRAFT_759466 [Suillus subaureus]KAG1792863.1 hypothetical protein BJ212DRAFT_787320 [Suillus subaureus]KAG1807326.1 hypothetical protein BJ212DRAFT_759466 [Suillus subaureus]